MRSNKAPDPKQEISRRMTCMAALLCLAVSGWDGATVEAQQAPNVAPPAATPGSCAIVVGVDEPDVAYRTNDAELLAATLQQCGYEPEHTLLMTRRAAEPNLHPLRANLEAQMASFLGRIDTEDRLLVYWAGRAYQDQNGQLYLAPSDWAETDPAGTGLAVTWLRQRLEACPAQAKLLVLDITREDSTTTGGAGASGVQVGSALEGVKGLAILASCRADEEPLTWTAVEQSLFGFWLTQALAGHADRDDDELVSMVELWNYVFEKVAETAKLVLDQRQTPMCLTTKPLPETSHVSRRTPCTLDETLDHVAKELAALAERNGVSRLGVTEFRPLGNDSRTAHLFGGRLRILRRSCAVELEHRLAREATIAGSPFELIPHDELHATLARGDFSPASLRTSAARGLNVHGKAVQAAVLGTFCVCTGKLLTLRCDLQHTRSQRLLGRVQATALLNPSQAGIPPKKPEDLSPPSAPSPEKPAAPGEHAPHSQKSVGSSKTPPAAPDSLYHVEIYVGDERRESIRVGNDTYVPLERGDVYTIVVENGSDKPVWMRLLVDGLNTLPEPVPGEVGADGQPTVVYRKAQRVSLDKARAWQPQPQTRHVFRGFYYRLGEGRQAGHGKYEWDTFKVVDAPMSLAYDQGYTEQIGLITAAFYEYEPPQKKPAEAAPDRSESRSRGRGLGTGRGEKRQGEVRECTAAPVGPLLDIVNIYYVEPEELDRLKREQALLDVPPEEDPGDPHDEATSDDSSVSPPPPKTDSGEPAEPSPGPADPAPEQAGGQAADTAANGPAAAVVAKYLAAAATLDSSATRPFLAATCQGDLVTEFSANATSRWNYAAKETRITEETIDAEKNTATVVAEIVFQGGGAFMAQKKTFFLVLEDGVWEISRIDPPPRTTGPGVMPLSP